MLEIQNLSVNYPTKWGPFKAVQGISLAMKAGEVLGLVGESGCGKSTLGKAILRLAPVTEGSVQWMQKELTTLSKSEFFSLRKEIQMVFQDPQSALNPKLNLLQALGEVFEIHQQKPKGELKKCVENSLIEVGLSPDDLQKYPHEFSGGQKQRIGIARALAVNPSFLICDEVVSALDVSVQAQVLKLLNDLKSQRSLGMLFITHDLGVVRYFCDRVAVMYFGKIVEEGTPDEVYENPKNPYTAKLLNSIAGVKSDRIFSEQGFEHYHPEMWETVSGQWKKEGSHRWLEI